MKSLLTQIESTQDLPGWCSFDKACRLASLVIALEPMVTVETGVFGGRSFLPLALAHNFIGKGTVIGIEPWKNDAAREGYSGEHDKYWGGMDFQSIRKQCLDRIQIHGVQNVCKVLEMKSDDYIPAHAIGLAHLDSQHTEQALREVIKLSPRIEIGGVIVLDDIHWQNGDEKPVSQAMTWLLANGYRKLFQIYKDNPAGGKDDYGAFQRIL